MALIGGAPFGYRPALLVLGWMVVGNLTGGVLVAGGRRLAQVRGIELRRQEREPASEAEQDDDHEGRNARREQAVEDEISHTKATPRQRIQRIFHAMKDSAPPAAQERDE